MPRRKNPQPSENPPPQRELRPRSPVQVPNMAGSKRSRPSEDPPPQRQVRPRSSAQAQSLPTPDDALSVDDSAASVDDSAPPPISLPAEKKAPAGPANPGVVRKRDERGLSKLPPDSDAEQEFGRLRRDDDLTDAEAFMKFLRTYDVSMRRLNQISRAFILFRFIATLFARASLGHILLTSSTTYSRKVARIVQQRQISRNSSILLAGSRCRRRRHSRLGYVPIALTDGHISENI